MQSSVNQRLDVSNKSWWLEISTQSPACHYHFGPFASESEVVLAQPGYEADLAKEGCELVGTWVVARHQPPANLTLE